MIVIDASVLRAHLGEECEASTIALEILSQVAGEPWACSPLALAEVYAPAADSTETLDRVQHVLRELKVIEVDLTSHAGVILGRLVGECHLSLAGAGTLQLALERDATVVTLDPPLRAACQARGLAVLPTAY